VVGSDRLLSRREMLATLAAGTAVAWTTPVMLSMTSRAAAGSLLCGNLDANPFWGSVRS